MILNENQEIGSDCYDDEFVSALLIEDIGEDECCWALVVEQVNDGEFLLKQSVDCCPQYEVLTDDECSLCVWDKTFGLTATQTTHTTYHHPLVIYEVGAATHHLPPWGLGD